MAIRYAAGLAGGHLLGTADAAAIVVPLHGQFADDAQAYFAPRSLVIVAAIVVVGTAGRRRRRHRESCSGAAVVRPWAATGP